MRKEKYFWGLFFIGAAIMLILNQMNILPDMNIFTFIFSVLLFYMLFKAIISRSIGGIVYPSAFLLMIYDQMLGMPNLPFWTTLIAAIFLHIGLRCIFPSKYYNEWEEKHSGSKEYVNMNQMEFNTSFADSTKYVESDDFTSAKVNCSFGALALYFDNATIQNEEAVIEFEASFCGIELFIPKDWNVINKCDCMFAGIEDHKRRGMNVVNAPTLILTGRVKFAGIEIHYI